MSGGDFLDSNVLIYVFDHTAPAKAEVALGLVRNGTADGSAVISFQVVQETLHALTRKFKPPVSAVDAARLLEHTLAPLMQVMPSAALYGEALRIAGRYQYSFYDSLIIASALNAGCKRLLTEDLQHGQVIEGLTIINPFK